VLHMRARGSDGLSEWTASANSDLLLCHSCNRLLEIRISLLPGINCGSYTLRVDNSSSHSATDSISLASANS
jgi:hypothetical protein